MTRHALWLFLAATLAAGIGTVPAAEAAGTDRVLAVVDGKVITEAGVRAANPALFNGFERRRRQWFHDQLAQDLGEMVRSRLIDAEAAARGITHQELVDGVTVAPVSDADVAAYYEKYKDHYGVPLEQATRQIRPMLAERRQSHALETFLKGLRSKFKVEEKLEPLREVVATDGPFDGPEKAPVTIVEFTNFECELCGQLTTTLQTLKARYPEKLKIVFRHLPLPSTPIALKAAEASLCAADQNAFWELHDLMFENQSALAVPELKNFASSLELNSRKFAACLSSSSEKISAEIRADLDEATTLGLTDAPAIFINGRFLAGEDLQDKQITAVIDDELKRRASRTVPGKQASDPKRVLAIVADQQPITEADVLAANAQHFKVMARDIERNLHDELESSLDRMINNMLVDAESASRGITREALLSEIKPAPVTDVAIDAFYEANKARIPRPKEEVLGQLKSYLEQQESDEALRAFVKALRSGHKVEVKLEPLRDVVAATGPTLGPQSAPVTLIEFSDFQCKYCKANNPSLEAVRARYGDKVRIVFRQFPLSMHRDAQKAAEASLCALEQGKFWELHDAMFKDQKALGVEDLKKSAAALGLDAVAFASCLDSGKTAPTVERDMNDGASHGVSGTPAMFINGRFLNGTVPLDTITAIIDDELRRHGS